MIFETVNPNAKGTLKQWLESTVAHVVCAQEVKANQEEIEELNEWCTKRGWQCLIAPCVSGQKHSERSAGVGIFVRNGIGLGWHLEPEQGQHKPCKAMYAGRSIAARVDIPKGVTLTLVCSYFHDGQKLCEEANADILQWNQTEIRKRGYPAVVAADFNNGPEDPYLARWCGDNKMVIKAVRAGGTFHKANNAGMSNLDYFLISQEISAICSEARVDKQQAVVRPHIPVAIGMRTQRPTVTRVGTPKVGNGPRP